MLTTTPSSRKRCRSVCRFPRRLMRNQRMRVSAGAYPRRYPAGGGVDFIARCCRSL